MSYERYTPDSRYSSPQQNPLIREAALIAQQMDSGNAELAGQRLRDDLYQLQRSPEQAQQLIQLVQQYDRKGSGADLEIRMGRQNGYSVANASIVDYDYYRDNRSGRVQRQQYNTDRICTIILPQDSGRNHNGRYQNDRQPYHDPRTSFDPRGGFDPRNSFDRGSYYRDMSAQFEPRDPSNWDPQMAWEANLRYNSRSSQFDPRSYSRNDERYYAQDDSSYYNPRGNWQNQQERYSGYRPDWQQSYGNPEPHAYIPHQRQNQDYYSQNQNYWQQEHQPNRNQHRRTRQSQGHSHNHGRNDSHSSASSGKIEGLDRDAAEALNYAQQMAARNGVKIQVTSGYRSYAEQSRLYAQLNGISPVAKPGTSNHETGEAIDVKNYAQAKPYLVAAGFVHGDGKGRIAGDPWHFRYMG